jgi:hypothetical protein
MASDPKQIEYVVQQLLRSGGRVAGLTELEKLVIVSIVQKITYRQAGTEYKYTESSFQNAASKLFKDLSSIVRILINRRNFLEVMEEQRSKTSEPEVVFDCIQANLWVSSEKARLVSISYQAPQVLDLTEYLVVYSQRFGATFCLDVVDKSSPLDLLWRLFNLLQATLPSSRHDTQALLKSIGAALKKRSTLLVIRFDRLPVGFDRAVIREYVQIFAALGMLENSGCWLIVDNDSAITEAEIRRSMSYQLRGAIDEVVLKPGRSKLPEVRLIAIENDPPVIYELLQTYLK